MSNAEDFIKKVQDELRQEVKHNKTSLEKLATSYSITAKNLVKELTELAIVMLARDYARNTFFSITARFNQIVKLYESQPNLSHRTSNSIKLQQYSTPAPIAFLAGIFAGIHEADNKSLFFEPSAGNGLLTIAGDPKLFIVNEIDKIRIGHLREQDFHAVTSMDGSKPFTRYQKSFDAVLTNPPFGKLEEPVEVDGYPIQALEHLMAIHALDTMLNEGKAAIIIGGHTTWDNKGRIQAGKNRVFFNYLYSHYRVKDVINIDGKLYARQGTAFDVRLILIDGRKKTPEGVAPLYNKDTDITISSFSELFERVMRHTESFEPLKTKETYTDWAYRSGHTTTKQYNEAKYYGSFTTGHNAVEPKPTQQPQKGYLFKVGDKVSFIGTAGKVDNGEITYLSHPGQYEVKTGKRSTYVTDDRLVPQIVSAKKYKESYGRGYKAFDKLKPQADDRYRVEFLDGKSLDSIKAEDRNEAMSRAIKHYLEKRAHEKKLTETTIPFPNNEMDKENADNKNSQSMTSHYKYKIGDKVTYIDVSSRNYQEGTIVAILDLPGAYQVRDKKSKEISNRHEMLLAPGVVSAKKYKQKTWEDGEYNPFPWYRFKVTFADGTVYKDMLPEDREEAISAAVNLYILEHSQDDDYIEEEPDTEEIELLALAAKAKLLLLRNRKKGHSGDTLEGVEKSKLAPGIFSSRTDEWGTPHKLYNSLNKEFSFNLDAAASSSNNKHTNYFTKKNSGLSQSWKNFKRVFVNPPYSQLRAWMQKIQEEIKNGCQHIVTLIPCRTDTNAWHEYAMKADEIRLIKGRLKYNDGENTAPFPSAIVVFRNPRKHKTVKISSISL